jgi:hypothetical protein
MNRPILAKVYQNLVKQFEIIKSNYAYGLKLKPLNKQNKFKKETHTELVSYIKEINNIKKNMDNRYYINHSIEHPSYITKLNLDKLENRINTFKDTIILQSRESQTGGVYNKTHKLSLNRKLKSKHKITKSTKHKINKTIKHKMNKTKKRH